MNFIRIKKNALPGGCKVSDWSGCIAFYLNQGEPLSVIFGMIYISLNCFLKNFLQSKILNENVDVPLDN